ncbi:MAG: hypothetical protein IT428_30660 [Planctomycetaceae bacterium]|nr:hypothetical protein [Planctomycetaceae bacterium]
MIPSNRTHQQTVRRMLLRLAIVLVITALAYAFRDRDAPLPPKDTPRADQGSSARPIPDETTATRQSAELEESSPSSGAVESGTENQVAEEPPSEAARPDPSVKAPPTSKEPSPKRPDSHANRPEAKKSDDKRPQAGKSDAGLKTSEDAEDVATDVIIRNVTIRDQSNRVVYRGDVNLTPTLDRIKKGVRNEHRNDGSTFQNREKRLPQRDGGYYKEYVHPTRGVSGPGPQRIILGKGGEIYYTSDHYGSFKRIK